MTMWSEAQALVCNFAPQISTIVHSCDAQLELPIFPAQSQERPCDRTFTDHQGAKCPKLFI